MRHGHTGARGHKDIKGLEHLSYKERLGKLGGEKAQRDLVKMYKYLVGLGIEGVKLFLVVPSDRMGMPSTEAGKK